MLDRDQPVARIVPLSRPGGTRGGVDERLLRLEGRGLIRRGTGGLPEWVGRRRSHRVRGSVLKDLLGQVGWRLA